MKNEKTKVLKSLGWTDEQLRMIESTPSSKAFEKRLMEEVLKSLEIAGASALEYVSAHPNLPTSELAKKLSQETGMKLSGVGFVMAVYNQAARLGQLRNLAKDLLIRRILSAFPNGWATMGDIHPAVRIGSWVQEIERSCDDESAKYAASAIIRNLAVDHQPPDGWLPSQADDPRIEELFARFWPAERKP